MDSDQRAMRHMKLPERGTFRVTAVHEGHSHTRIGGVITAPGIPPTRVEHKMDGRGEPASAIVLATQDFAPWPSPVRG